MYKTPGEGDHAYITYMIYTVHITYIHCIALRYIHVINTYITLHTCTYTLHFINTYRYIHIYTHE